MKKQLKELAIIAIIFSVLYFTGWHTEVIALTQRAVLSTGIFNPGSDDLSGDNTEDFDYAFKVKSLEGDVLDFSEYKEKVVFLNLWASWCGPCRAEMPGIEKLYDELKDEKDIAFVILSLDRNPEEARKYIENKEFTFPVYVLAGYPTDQINAPNIPTTYVVSPEGKIIYKKAGMAKYNTRTFREYLKEQARP
ncbi:MAG: TlpA family protein disulfide reductase [Cyclobacteriaceae bacterium]|nr:TlpA family protein disulfide reductase [Cyclobacteriaceae bacterium]